jgi:hypothetical protein
MDRKRVLSKKEGSSFTKCRGAVAGQGYRDTVTIANFTVQSQVLGAANRLTSSFTRTLSPSALLGLAFSSALSSLGGYNFVENLVMNDLVRSCAGLLGLAEPSVVILTDLFILLWEGCRCWHCR